MQKLKKYSWNKLAACSLSGNESQQTKIKAPKGAFSLMAIVVRGGVWKYRLFTESGKSLRSTIQSKHKCTLRSFTQVLAGRCCYPLWSHVGTYPVRLILPASAIHLFPISFCWAMWITSSPMAPFFAGFSSSVHMETFISIQWWWECRKKGLMMSLAMQNT